MISTEISFLAEHHPSMEKSFVMLAVYKKKASLKTLSSNDSMADSRNELTAYLTAENLRVKVTVKADTGFDYSAISRSAVEYARECGFPLLD
jgi:hypothetical protein